jgi:iron complex transport system permease protein
MTKKRRNTVIVAMFFLLTGMLAANIMLGSVNVTLGDIAAVLRSGDNGDIESGIVWKLRLPRTLACVFLGGALGQAGFLLQTFFNNPIAGPYVLGISSGAKLTVALAMVAAASRSRMFVPNAAFFIVSAFVGSMITIGVVALLAKNVKRAAVLIVSGIMIGYICSAITDFVVTFASDESIVNLHNWSLGSFSGTSWDDVKVMSAVVTMTAVPAVMLSKPIGAYYLGENYAQSMGVNIKRLRLSLVFLSGALSACVVAFAGPISFVGVAVPHLIRSALKTTKPLVVLPLCFFGGSIFCLGCDLIARTAFAPAEMSVSSVSALFGAPIVMYVMTRRQTKR